MQLGMIGLGRMGANLVRRLMKAGHECVVYDVAPEPVEQLASEGAVPASSLEDFVAKLNGDEVSQGTAKAIHYWKARYPSEPGADSYRDYGQPDLQKVPADQREEFFDIVLTAGEA